jgi:hypothetical protein
MKARLKAGIAVLAAIGTGTVLLVVSRPGAVAGRSEKEWNELNAKVERLERTTARLQNELDEARKPFPALTTQPAQIINPPGMNNLTVPGSPAPPGSRPFVFNGITYYVTPLAQAR